ncbi:MAG TPA: ATP-binding protein [Polyangiaceae bacterium]|nr:ATP-binding protein [Polyangiaceae bacterium]
MRTLKTKTKTAPAKRMKTLRLPATTVPKLASSARVVGAKRPDTLERKYALLCQKYLKAIRQLKEASSKRLVTFHLGWWALQSTSAALALIRNGKILICNSRFHELNRGGEKQGWIRLDSTAPETIPQPNTLWTLVSREAAAIFDSGQELATRRYKRIDKDEYVEASYQRSGLESDPVNLTAIVQDATQRVRAERELDRVRESLIQQERLRAIGELASGVAHDLNNTLHAMSLRLSLIEQNRLCQAEQGDNIRALGRIVTDAALVVGRLQDFARQRHDRPLESVDLAAIVAEAIEIVRTGIEGQSSLEGAPIRILTELEELAEVRGLASDLRHVIVNLLLNARDAMPNGGSIRIVGEQHHKRIVLKVLDEGRGIPEEDLGRIFDPFFTTKGNRGTGLGLSIAYGVLTRLGGEVSANNRPEGGACFTLSFPVAARSNKPPPPPPPSIPPRGKHILVIDDDLDNLEATRMAMELQGQAVDMARNGSEALERFKKGQRYDLVLCDLGMPDMNGWLVAREIQDVAPGTTVYMLTGWAQHIADDDPRRRWVKGVLEKPMNLEHLRDLLSAELAPFALNSPA